MAAPQRLRRDDSNRWSKKRTLGEEIQASKFRVVRTKAGAGGNARISMVREKANSVDGLQLLAGLEAHRFTWRNGNLGAGAWVPSDTGLARSDIEHTKASQLNTIALSKRPLHAAEHCLHGQFGLGFSDSCLVDHFVDDIELDHRRSPGRNR